MKVDLALVFCVFLLLSGPTSEARSLTIDVDSNEVGMRISFTGDELIVFGTISEGENIVVVLIGPREDVDLYQKVKSFGIWANRKIAQFSDVPSYYYLSANHRFLLLEDIPQGQFLIRNEVGFDHIRMLGENKNNEKKKIIQTMRDKNLYAENHTGVRLVDKNLFRTTIPIPSNAPAGVYTLRVFTFGADNYSSELRILPVFVRKKGVIALVSHYARENAGLYGLSVILVSFIVGISMVFVLRRLRS